MSLKQIFPIIKWLKNTRIYILLGVSLTSSLGVRGLHARIFSFVNHWDWELMNDSCNAYGTFGEFRYASWWNKWKKQKKKRRKEGGKEGRMEGREGEKKGGKEDGRKGSRRQASCWFLHRLFQEIIHIFMDKLLVRRWIGAFQNSMTYLNGSLTLARH